MGTESSTKAPSTVTPSRSLSAINSSAGSARRSPSATRLWAACWRTSVSGCRSRPSASTTGSDPDMRVQCLTQAVAQQLEPENGHENHCPGRHHQPGRSFEVLETHLDHCSPRRCRRLYAHAEETQASLRDDGETHAERRVHNNRTDDIRQETGLRREPLISWGVFAGAQHGLWATIKH